MHIKLLVADDEVFIREAYSDGFTNAGFTVTTAVDGQQALEMIQDQPPDIMLLDLIMPRKTGFDVLRAVKSDPRLQHIPVVILTNLSQVSDEQEALSLGATSFLVKSDYSLKEVVERVQAVISAAKP